MLQARGNGLQPRSGIFDGPRRALFTILLVFRGLRAVRF
jgi:hypothetical protein